MLRPVLVSLVVSACTPSAGPHHALPDSSTPLDAPANDALDAADAPDAPPTECNGYEPCGIHPVVVPDGYTLLGRVDTDEYGASSSCTDWADCGMWNTHYTSNYVDSNGVPVDPYYNRMGSPFPWGNSRYDVIVQPKKIQYAKLHVLAPGEMYGYTDGTLEQRIDRTTGATTCFQRGASMAEAIVRTLGGTKNYGTVTWNISVLPGDMGNSGNASSCTGSGTRNRPITADPATAATPDSQGNLNFCLLREGHDYYINFQSSGAGINFDCATDVCSMGGLFVANFAAVDGSSGPQVEVPCP